MTTPISDVSANKNNYGQTTVTDSSNNAVGKALSTGNVGSTASDTYSVQEQKKQAELIELKNKINSLCDMLGTTSSQVFSIFGQNIENEESLTVEECKKRLEALNTAIKDATVNGKLDKELAIELAKNYTIALNTGWSINGLKTRNKNEGALPLKERLIKAGYLKNTGNDVSEEELEKAAEKLFKGLFDDKLSKAKTQKERDDLIKQQIQTFGRLLINTKGEDRTILVKAVKNLLQENRVEGVKNLFISSVDDEQKHEMAAKLKNEMFEIAEGLKDEVIQIEALRAINLSAEDKKQLPNEVKSEWENFLKKYSDADVKAIIELYNKKPSDEEIPEQYREALKEYIYLINISSGDKTGLAVKDTNLSETEHFNINKELDSNIKSFGTDTYNAVQVKTAEVIDKHPELLNMSKDEIVEFLDKVSDGQFSTIVKESGVAQGLIKGDAASSTGVGLGQQTTQETFWSTSAALEQKIQELYKAQEDENKSYVVETNVKKDETSKPFWQKFQTVKGLSAKDLLDGIANKYIKITEVLDKYNDLTQSAKDFINNLIKSMSRGIQNYILNTLKGDVALDIAESANIDISKLKLDHLSFDQRQRAEAIKEKTQTNK